MPPMTIWTALPVFLLADSPTWQDGGMRLSHLPLDCDLHRNLKDWTVPGTGAIITGKIYKPVPGYWAESLRFSCGLRTTTFSFDCFLCMLLDPRFVPCGSSTPCLTSAATQVPMVLVCTASFGLLRGGPEGAVLRRICGPLIRLAASLPLHSTTRFSKRARPRQSRAAAVDRRS